jgi:hypothetical protein
MGTIREIKVTGRNYELSVFVDEEDYQTLDLGSYNWSRLIGCTTTYVKTHKKGKTILLHRLIMGLENAPRSVLVDHKDHNGLNNCRTNLRKTDSSGNHANYLKRLSAKNFSPYKGVHLCSDKRSKPWRADIKLSGKNKHLGYYRTQEEAALAYNKAAIEHFGDMANLNIIGP